MTLNLPLSGSWRLLATFGTNSRVFRTQGSSAISLSGMPEYLLPLQGNPAAAFGIARAGTLVPGSATAGTDPTPTGTMMAEPRQTATEMPAALP